MNHLSSCILSSLFLLGLTIFVRSAETILTLLDDNVAALVDGNGDEGGKVKV